MCMIYLKECLENKLPLSMPSDLTVTSNVVEDGMFFSGGFLHWRCQGIFSSELVKTEGLLTLVKLLLVIRKSVECLIFYSSLNSYVQMRN